MRNVDELLLDAKENANLKRVEKSIRKPLRSRLLEFLIFHIKEDHKQLSQNL